jgi:hypothetical protein
VAWSSVLHEGLVQLRKRLGCSHVFVLLEDHVPLRPCDGALITELCDVARDADLRCLYFCMHDWPWQSTACSIDADGRIRGWQTIDVVSIRGHRMARMARNDLFFNRCQPALWSIDDYIELTAAAVRAGIDDPWRFETFLPPGQPDHFVSEYRWPSRKSGYRRNGKVYLRALYLMAMPGGFELRDELLRERFPRLPPRLRRGLGDLLGLWGRLRAGLSQRGVRPARSSRGTAARRDRSSSATWSGGASSG